MDQPTAPILKARLPRHLSPWGLAAGVLAVCLALTWQVWHGALLSQEGERRAAFDLRAREAAAQLSQRMASYVQLLRGVQGLFASSQQVTRTEFADFVFAHDLDRQLPGVQAIAFMAAVPPAQRDAHVAQMRRQGAPDYSVWPPGERSVYAPIVYIEPFHPANARVLGYDGWSDPVRRAMLEQARDSGQPALSGPLKLLQEQDGRPLNGFVIALPVYRNGVTRASEDERRAALAGWVVAPFIAADVLASLDHPHTNGLRLSLVDGVAVAGPRGIRASLHSVAVGPQRLQVQISEIAPSAAPMHGAALAPLTIGLLGVGVSLGLSALTWMLARSSVAAGRALARTRMLAQELEVGRQQAEALADTAHRTQSMMRSILDSTTEGILVDDGDGRILVSNERFRTMWKVPPRLDLGGSDLTLLEHMAGQLEQAGAFLHGQSLTCHETRAQRAALLLKDGRMFEQTLCAVRLGQGSARLWSYRDITEQEHQCACSSAALRAIEAARAGGAAPPI